MHLPKKFMYGLVAGWLVLFLLGVSSVLAEPSDPFTGASPSFDAAPEEPENYNVGDWGVAERRGAATYTFPIDVPPGRNGMAPSLALRYSSHSPLRGGIAVGWTLDIPAIRIDTALGKESERFYKASLRSASGRLVEVPDESPYLGKAYRAEFDNSFTRFFNLEPNGAVTNWVALTPDGVKHYFDFERGASDGSSRWYITRQVDPFGNIVRYLWSPVHAPSDGRTVIDLSLVRIEYTSNEAAGLDAHAKVEFEYAPLEVCSYSDVPIGAATRPMSPGTVEGARRLTAIKTYVRDEPGGAWRLSKEMALEYELRSSVLHYAVIYPDPPPPDIYCTQNPLRYLTQISVTAYDSEGTATSLPPITFEYNYRINTTAPVLPFTPPPLQERTINTPGYGHYGTTDGAIGTLLDIDSDGIRDRVSVVEQDDACTLVWQKGLLGGDFDMQEHESPLPTFLWYYETERNPDDTVSEKLPGEHCTINGQITLREKVNPPDEWHDKPWYSREKTIYGYHFMDYTGDGRLDLIIPPNSGPSSTLLDDYPPDLPLPVSVTTTEDDAPYNHTWWLYHNATERPEYNQLHGVESVFSVQAFTIAAPVALAPPGNEEIEINFQVPIKSLPPTVFDLDGDGFPDAVRLGRSGAYTYDCEGAPVDYSRPRWCVYFGKGGQTFSRGYAWYVPLTSTLAWSGVGAYSITEYENATSTFHQNTWTVAGLYDVTGDGLSDFVVVDSASGALQAYINSGTGFSGQPIELFRYTPYVDPFVDKTQTDYRATVDPDLADEGHRGHRRRIVDLDGDGRLDMISFYGYDGDITAQQSVVARFNFGDRLGRRVELPSAWLSAKRLLAAEGGDWRTDTDFVDVTGDGLADLVSWNSDNTLTYINSPGLPDAPDLLRVVENGRGLRVEFSYAPTTDPDVVQWTTLTPGGPYLPSVMWVVDESTVEGGYDTPTMVTRYTYKDPRYLSPSEYTGIPERSHFAGFEETIKTVYASEDVPARRVKRAYAYDDTGAPDGRLVQEWIYRAEAGVFHLHKYKEITWQRKPLFFGEVSFTHRDATLTRTCEPDMTEAECMTQTENVHRLQQTWEDVAPSKYSPGRVIIDPVNHPPELYVQTATQEGSGLAENEQDRRTSYGYYIRYGQGDFAPDDYRVLTTLTTLAGAVDETGSTFEERGRTRNHYDPVTGLPVQTDVWLNESVVATTKRTFDPQTGNLLSETKPEQLALGGSGNSMTYSYDPHQLFVETTTNELGHQVITRDDVATGVLLERKGPNFLTLPSDDVVWERETWQIDGFGRVLTHAISIDDDAAGYLLQVVDKTTHFDFEEPNRIHEEHLRDFGGDVWLTTDRTVDGLGRVLTETVHLDGGQVAITSYEYDSIGNLIAIEVPDPRTDGAQVSYEYHHDGLGRLTGFDRPDDNGLSITYDGLEKTIQEVTADGSGSTKKQVFDVLGRLVELYEFDPDAVTRYQYDVNDNLIEIVDAEGNLTELAHDWTGNRVTIIRGDRTWRYVYDLNGNLVEEISPLPAGQDPAPYKVFHEYDDLDRVTTVSFVAVRPGSSAKVYPPFVVRSNSTIASAASRPSPRAEVAANDMVLQTSQQVTNTIRYFYDDGPNGLGRLDSVELPFGVVQYAYDARGLVMAETRAFTLSDIASVSASQTVQREYNALGLPTLSTWDDGQQWQITYDERGLVDTVEWYDPQANAWQQVADYDRAIAGLPRTRNTSFGQARQFTYDVLGRPILDTVMRPGHPNGALVSTRAYDYTDSGDLVSVSGTTDGVSAAASYTYDAQHRLTAATGPNGYLGSFTYSPAGNIQTADVTWNGSPETRNVRYEYGARDPQAVDRLVDVAGDDTYAHFAYDLAGNMIERTTPEGTWTLDWDGLDQIRMVQSPNGAEVYFYDHSGARMLSVNETDGVRFWFAESETHYDLDGAQTRRYLHLSGGGPTLARVENGTEVELQYADALQNLMFSLDAEGNLVASFLYGPFGEVVYSTGEEDHRRQFNGKEKDALTGLRYYGYRYYDPLILRWNSADPLYRFVPDLGQTEPQRMNLYTFSLNNPVRYYDPDGRDANDADDEREGLTCEQAEPGPTCELDDEESDQDESETCEGVESCEDTGDDQDGDVDDDWGGGTAAGPRGLQGDTGQSIGNRADPATAEELKQKIDEIKNSEKSATKAEKKKLLKERKKLQKRLKAIKGKSKRGHGADKAERGGLTASKAVKTVAVVGAGVTIAWGVKKAVGGILSVTPIWPVGLALLAPP